MGNVIALVLPFFSMPTNYSEMLKKLAGLSFYETYIITLMLRSIPSYDNALRGLETNSAFGKIIMAIPHADAFNIAGFGIAFLLAILTNVVQMHDRISDIFRIRLKFDVNNILLPLARLVGSNLDSKQKEAVRSARPQLMQEVFYNYASSRAEHPLVDKHDIEHAIGNWSWFWVFIEAIPIWLVATIVALIGSSRVLAAWFCLVVVISELFVMFLYPRLERYAQAEIETIARDPTAAFDVRTKFDAL